MTAGARSAVRESAAPAAAGWRGFWNGGHSIYVNARHIQAHYRQVAEDLIAVLPRPDAVVLDYGCGEALFADRVAARCAKLLLCEAAPAVRGRLRARFAGTANIEVLSDGDLAAIEGGSLDLVVVNSVVQYLTPAQFEALLGTARAKLRPGGRLVLADILPETPNAVDDASALLGFAWREGFFLGAILGLARTLFSDYRRLRRRLGLTGFSEAAMLGHLARAGFAAERRRPNFGHNQARMAFIAMLPSQGSAEGAATAPGQEGFSRRAGSSS